jgi:Spy/CpxP family protein refolding chaperone
MISTRTVRSETASAFLIACVALSSCAGENTTVGGAAAPPPPSAAAPPASPGPPLAQQAAPVPPPSAPPPSPQPAAQPSTSGQGAELAEGDEHRGQHHGGVLMLVAMSLKDLDLSPDQRTAVDKIRADFVAKMEPARAAGKDLANTLADGVAAGAVDRPKTDAAINKLVTQVQGLHDPSLVALNQLHAALTAQQRAALVDAVQAHWEKWKDAHGRDEQDDHQHRSGHLLSLVKELGLTKDEAAKIKANFHERMKNSPQDQGHKEVQDHLQAFATAFKGEAFNAKSLAGAKAADGHMARWGATRMARFFEAAAPVLTPDQRTKLAQTIRDRANRTEL